MVVVLIGVCIKSVNVYEVDFGAQIAFDEFGHNGQLLRQIIIRISFFISSGIISIPDTLTIPEGTIGDLTNKL